MYRHVLECSDPVNRGIHKGSLFPGVKNPVKELTTRLTLIPKCGVPEGQLHIFSIFYVVVSHKEALSLPCLRSTASQFVRIINRSANGNFTFVCYRILFSVDMLLCYGTSTALCS